MAKILIGPLRLHVDLGILGLGAKTFVWAPWVLIGFPTCTETLKTVLHFCQTCEDLQP